MGLAQLKDQIGRLPAEQQLDLVEAIWDQLAGVGDIPMPPGHLHEVLRRLDEHDVSPDDVIPWEDLKRELGP